MPENEFIYVFDPLCGWCYGFDEHLLRLQKKFGSDMPFTVFSGGMIIDENAKPIAESAEFIKSHIPAVEEATGVTFGKPFLDLMEEGTYHLDSEPPSRALKVFKRLGDRTKSLQFGSRIQEMLYKEGKDLNQVEVYLQDAEKFGVDPSLFRDFFEEENIKRKTREEFDFTRSLGVRGYPTLILRTGDKGAVISRGFLPFRELVRAVETVFANTGDN
ncbi:DsbA family protein [Roseivirga sp. BDSF3-8]|uniref:DsbA family protein n=1 Tax=Roseivirga sp. BDSF3-8 TaxID=3241598 RepID=UPI003531A253